MAKSMNDWIAWLANQWITKWPNQWITKWTNQWITQWMFRIKMEAYNKIYGMGPDSPGRPGRFQVRILELNLYQSDIYLSAFKTCSR